MDNVLVTVCCCTFNHESYIRDCLEGFISQKTDFPVEYIIHDDASTDETPRIVLEYAKAYPDKIVPILQGTNQYSQGVDPFSQIVLPRAKGKYVALCDGDDYWTDPNKLQKEVDILKSIPCLMGVVTNSMTVDQFGNTLSDKRDRIYPENRQGRYTIDDFFQLVPNYPTATVVFKNDPKDEILQKIIHTKNKYLGDWTLWAILHSYGDFYYLDEVTSAYRVNPTSMTHTVDRVGRAKANLAICKSLSEVLPPEYAHYLKKDGWMYFSVFMAYHKEKRYVKMIESLLYCLIRYPKYTIKRLYSIMSSN